MRLIRASANAIPLPDASVQTCVTSPPYWGLRSYAGEQQQVWGGDPEHAHEWGEARLVATGNAPSAKSTLTTNNGQGPKPGDKYEASMSGVASTGSFCPCGAWYGALGLEPTPELYVAHLVEVFREVRRVLRTDGTLWLNLGDSYNNIGGTVGGGKNVEARQRTLRTWAVGLKPKDLVGIPWMVAFALRADGWYLRSDIIWHKPNPMPESVTDRPTKAHEYLFLLTKSERYFYDADAIREPITDVASVLRHKDTGRGDQGYAVASGQGLRPQRNSNSGLGGNVETGRNKRTVWTVATRPFPNVPARRAGVGGTDRRWSPGCPVHEDQRHLDATDECGEPLTASQSGSTTHSGDHPAQSQPSAHAPIVQRLVAETSLDSSDSLALASAQTATPRSTQSRRTARAPETSQHETGGAGLAPHTGGISQSPEPAATVVRSPESSIEAGYAEDEQDSYREPETPSRSACTCTSMQSISHFAVYPPDLIEPCILAGSSPKACGVCGAPWERVTENGETTGRTALNGLGNGELAKSARFGDAHRWSVGWQPTCAHDDGSGQSVVLDPFNGSGTTGVVAVRHNREYVGVDISDEYMGLARQRINEVQRVLF
jgi:DNA modification methylase